MGKSRKERIADYLRYTARYVSLTLGILVFVFALLSGSESFGGGIKGIIKNSPNALPWFVLLIIIFIAWKRELVGGIIITLMGFFALYFFNFRGPNFFMVTFILCLSIIILGSFFIISWYLRKKLY